MSMIGAGCALAPAALASDTAMLNSLFICTPNLMDDEELKMAR